jgi:PilZ domain-containing protein
MPEDRRRFQRYALSNPLGARVDAIAASITDASEKGLGVVHAGKFPNVGTTCRIIVQSTIGPITVDCQVVHTTPNDATTDAGFMSGLRVIAADFQSERRFRELLRSLMGRRDNGA